MASGPTAGRPVFVEVLTDEELAVVAPPGAMPVQPYLDDLDESSRAVALRTAYRSLVARGIVTAPTPEAKAAAVAAHGDTVDAAIRRDVASVVALRAGARLVVALARTTAVTQDFWYGHLVDDVVLLEEVSKDGLHRFALADADHLEALVTDAVVHPEATDSTGEPHLLAGDELAPPDAVLEQLGAAFVRVDGIVRYPGDHQPPTFAAFSGPSGCWWVAGGVEPARAEPLAVADARTRVSAAVRQARAESRVLHG